MTTPLTYLRLAPQVISDLIADFGLSPMHAAAIVGNGGHESAGFTKLQEISPTVAGSRGGFGWFQWTGPRRRAFEAWCATQKLALTSYAANYGFLRHELSGDYARVLANIKRKDDLRGAVVAFELGYEQAGVKDYDSRLSYAQVALAAWDKAHPVAHPQPPDIPKAKPKPAPKRTHTRQLGALAALWAMASAYMGAHPFVIGGGVFLIVLALIVIHIVRNKK